MDGIPTPVQERRAALRAAAELEVALFVDYDLADAEQLAAAGLTALGAMTVRDKEAVLAPTVPITATEDALLLADLYDRMAICRMVRGDFDATGTCLAREVAIRPPGKRADGRISALDDLQVMCASKQLPVVMPNLVMVGQPRVKLLLFLGGFQMYRGELVEAGRLYRLVESDRKATAAQGLCARYELAELARLGGDAKQACDQWDALVEASPRSPFAAKSLCDAAQAYAGTGDIAGSEARFLRVLSEHPDYPDAHRVLYNLGFLYLFTEQHGKAEATFRKLVKKRPDSWEAQRVQRVELPDLVARAGTLETKQPKDP
ncbi:MAG: tetratricopeptide repeat protein [Planctomycetes bacterium]|nr:tetratricopeptide repeat protein [Planctomycetota bacterium]